MKYKIASNITLEGNANYHFYRFKGKYDEK